MNLFFDTEFTGLHKDTTLISLGIVAENGKKFYAEFFDYEETQCDDWIKKNVIENLRLHGVPHTFNLSNDIKRLMEDGYEILNFPYSKDISSVPVYGTKRESKDGITEVCGASNRILEELKDWLSQFDEVQFVSDVCHYDFVLLIDLFGTAFDLPKNVSPVCHDINQDIARHYEITEKEAFEMSREKIVNELCKEPVKGNKHNALYDAEVIKAIFEEVS